LVLMLILRVLVLLLSLLLLGVAAFAARMEDRPMLIVSQTWPGDTIVEQSTVPMTFEIFNAGPIEAVDIKLSLPEMFQVNPVAIPNLGPDKKHYETIQVKVKSPVVTSAVDAAAKMEYKAKGSPIKFLGHAIPSKDFSVLSAADHLAHNNKHYTEWGLWVLLSFGVGVLYPATRLHLLLSKSVDFPVVTKSKRGARKLF